MLSPCTHFENACCILDQFCTPFESGKARGRIAWSTPDLTRRCPRCPRSSRNLMSTGARARSCAQTMKDNKLHCYFHNMEITGMHAHDKEASKEASSKACRATYSGSSLPGV
jgi:hypothetical protein